jgi:hypothetical protein
VSDTTKFYSNACPVMVPTNVKGGNSFLELDTLPRIRRKGERMQTDFKPLRSARAVS